MSTKFELPFDTCFACFQKSDDNCSCKSRKIYEQGKADAIEEFRKFSYCKVCEEKGWNIYCDYCRVCQAQEYIAEQLKERNNDSNIT